MQLQRYTTANTRNRASGDAAPRNDAEGKAGKAADAAALAAALQVNIAH